MRIEHDGITARAPDFLIVGAPRCGTSALHAYLSSHPRVFVPVQKEPMFFSCWGREPFKDFISPHPILKWMISDPAAYTALFEPASPDQLLGEASTWYLPDHEHVISRIHRLYGDHAEEIKIMILLRNPADRAWSQYLMKLTEKREDRDFESALAPDVVASRLANRFSITYDYIRIGRYYSQVKAYLESFPRVKVFIFEEFFRETERSMDEVYDFLGLEPPQGKHEYRPVNISGLAKGGAASAALDLVYKPNPLKSIVKCFLPLKFRAPLKYHLKKRLLQRVGLSPDLKRGILERQIEDIHSLERLLGRDLSLWYGTPEKEGCA